MADALPFARPPCLMRPESAVTSSEASVSGGTDAVGVEESPRANLKGGLANRPACQPAYDGHLFVQSLMVLFEAVWLETCKPGCGGAFAALNAPGGPTLEWRALEFFGAGLGPDGPEGPWERSWEALLESLGKAHLQRPKKSTKHLPNKWITFWGSNIATLYKRFRYGRPPLSVPGGVSTVCELACTGQGGEALPSPLRDPLFLTCARAVSPRPAFGVLRLTAATPHLV